jgi:ankyrin repeat and LEM domain-containing protein 2
LIQISETPLHFACKFGSYEVAKILISFENCCKNPLNKNGKTPEEIICTHQTASKDKLEAIKNLFEGIKFFQTFLN